MYRGKLKRKNLSVDMTAMCDVAFLILIFFILVAKPKIWRPIEIERPLASGGIYDPDGDEVKILIAQGKVMFEIPNKEDRRLVLSKIGVKHHISFSISELKNFEKIETISVPISVLKQFIDGYDNGKTFDKQSGILINPTNNDLADWIDATKMVYKEDHGKGVAFIIDADKRELYPDIEKIMNILGSQGIFKFQLNYDIKQTKQKV
jgi:biopolymer transport protein ExbD